MTKLNFQNKNLQGKNFSNMNLRGANFKNSNLEGVDFRGSDLRGANIEGANLFGSDLEGALLDDIIYDENTKYYQMYCPREGAFLGYKKCCDYRLVQLLIPSDAKRTSATRNSCRCDKAKVLTIKSLDFKEYYDEAVSFVDESFIYKVGQWVLVENFNEDRWVESTTGIHFFMTREEAIGYL